MTISLFFNPTPGIQYVEGKIIEAKCRLILGYDRYYSAPFSEMSVRYHSTYILYMNVKKLTLYMPD